MKNISPSLKEMKSGEDLFAWWEQELTIRKALRNMSFPAEILEEEEECDLLYRAWYFTGRRSDFFDLLLTSLDNWAAIRWLSNRPVNLVNEFLEHLAWKLCTETIKPEKLQFLINLYRNNHLESLNKVINVLNLEQCRYLAARCGNSNLREVLKQQETTLLLQSPLYAARFDRLKKTHLPFPGVHGDKMELMQDAAVKIALAIDGRFPDPVGRDRFNAWLEACESVYRSGLLDDAFLMLKDLYDFYQEKNRIASVFADAQIHKNFTRLARSLLPILALLRNSRSPFDASIRMYDRYFNRLNRDPGSLSYLALLESIREGLRGYNQEIFWEVLYKCDLIRQYRSWDRGLLQQKDIASPVGSSRVQELLDIAAERLASRPHEALTILELLRLMHVRGLLTNNQLPAVRMLDMYHDLWQWLPSSLFINRGLLEHLSPLLASDKRRLTERLMAIVKQYTKDKTSRDLTLRSQIFRQKHAQTEREVLLGHILGVLD